MLKIRGSYFIEVWWCIHATLDWLTVAQVMACRRLCVKPLPEQMLAYCQLEPLKQISMKLESKYEPFHTVNCSWKFHLQNTAHYVEAFVYYLRDPAQKWPRRFVQELSTKSRQGAEILDCYTISMTLNITQIDMQLWNKQSTIVAMGCIYCDV